MNKNQLRFKRATTIILTVISVATGEVFAAGTSNLGSGSISLPPPPPPLPPAPPPPPPASLFTQNVSSKIDKTSSKSVKTGEVKESKEKLSFVDSLKEIAKGNFKLKKTKTKEPKSALTSTKDTSSNSLKDSLAAVLEARFKAMNQHSSSESSSSEDSDDEWNDEPVKVKQQKAPSNLTATNAALTENSALPIAKNVAREESGKLTATITNVAEGSSISLPPPPPQLPPAPPPPPPASLFTQNVSSEIEKPASKPEKTGEVKESKGKLSFVDSLKEIAKGNFKLKNTKTKEAKAEAATIADTASNKAKNPLEAALQARFKEKSSNKAPLAQFDGSVEDEMPKKLIDTKPIKSFCGLVETDGALAENSATTTITLSRIDVTRNEEKEKNVAREETQKPITASVIELAASTVTSSSDSNTLPLSTLTNGAEGSGISLPPPPPPLPSSMPPSEWLTESLPLLPIASSSLTLDAIGKAEKARSAELIEIKDAREVIQKTTSSNNEVGVAAQDSSEPAAMDSTVATSGVINIQQEEQVVNAANLASTEPFVPTIKVIDPQAQPFNILGQEGAKAAMPDSGVKTKEEETAVESQTVEVSSSNALDAADDIEQASKVGQQAVTTIEPLTGDILSSRTTQIEASFEAAMQMIDLPHHLIKNRLFGFGNNPALIAVAAGDEEPRVKYGVWGSGGFVASKQSATGNIAGYKGRGLAATIGMDTEIGEGSIIGLAYSNVRSILKFNETYGKSRINSHILSLYYQRDLGGNLGLQLMASLSGSEIRNKVNVERHGKSYAGSYGVEGDISYRHNCDSGMQLISIMGLKYHYIRGGLYKEQDSSIGYMLKVLGKSERMLAGTLGGKIIFKEMDLGSSLRLVPSVSASYEKNFTRSRRVVIGTVVTSDKPYGEVRVEMPRAFKQGCNLGAGVALVSNVLRLEVDYNYHLQKAYRSHEGIVKLKVSL